MEFSKDDYPSMPNVKDPATDVKKAVIEAATFDTLQNLVANLNTGRDKTTYGNFIRGRDLSIERVQCDTIYRFQWPAKVIDIPPYDMTREWRTWTSINIDPKQIEAITAEEKRLQYKPSIQETLTWGALYGGCAIVISVDGHGDASTPLDVTKVRKGQLKRLYVVDRHRIFPQTEARLQDPLDVNYGEPEFYRLFNTSQLVHRSRIVKFIGHKAPYYDKIRLLWWGDSVLNRIYDTIRNTETVISSIATMIHETNIDVLSIDGLASYLSSEGTEEIVKRFELMALMKAINNMMLLDGSTETYDRKGADFKQLPKLMEEFLVILSAASNIPATRFLGKSPDGMNATGESDLTIYYDMISGKQESDLEPQMRYIDQVMIRSLLGSYPEGLDWTFNPLWQLSESQMATINLNRSQTLMNLQSLGVPDEAILRDVQEMGLSNNLTDELIAEAIAEVEPDDDAEEELKGESPEEEDGNNETPEPDDDDKDKEQDTE